MGGPHSPLCWAIGYDPIVEGLEKAVACDTPTYVDDLAANTTGPTQTSRAAWCLLAAGHAAGLQADTHTCKWLQGPTSPTARDRPSGTSRCISWPRAMRPRSSGSHRGPRDASWPPRAEKTSPTNGGSRSTCKIKTAVVPSAAVNEWEDALWSLPFGKEQVRAAWPYLGAVVASGRPEVGPRK